MSKNRALIRPRGPIICFENPKKECESQTQRSANTGGKKIQILLRNASNG